MCELKKSPCVQDGSQGCWCVLKQEKSKQDIQEVVRNASFEFEKFEYTPSAEVQSINELSGLEPLRAVCVSKVARCKVVGIRLSDVRWQACALFRLDSKVPGKWQKMKPECWMCEHAEEVKWELAKV